MDKPPEKWSPPKEWTCAECGKDCEKRVTHDRFNDENGDVRWFCVDCFEQHEREWNKKERAEREAKRDADREISKTYYNEHGGYDWKNRDA